MTERLITIGADTRGYHEVRWAQGIPHPVLGPRPATPLPAIGDAVLYRSNDWSDTVPAKVLAVNIEPGSPSANLWQPWPTLLLLISPAWPGHKLDTSGKPLARTAGPRPYQVKTMESRLVGSAGWLPLDHAKRIYPEQGF